MKKSDELRQSLHALRESLQAMHDKAEREQRDLNGEEQRTWTSGIATVDTLTSQLNAELERESGVSKLRMARLAMGDPNAPQGSIPTARVSQPNVRPPKLRAYTGNGDKHQAARDAYDVGLWLKASLLNDADARAQVQARRGAEWMATMVEGSPADGGYLVPSPMHNGIIESREKVGAMRKLAQEFPMDSNTLDAPKFSSGCTVYYPGEAGTITPSDMQIADVGLTAKKRAILCLFSSELRDDSLISVTDLLTRDMGHQLALKEDIEGILGDGTGTYGGETGLLAALGAAGVVTATTTTEDTWAELTLSNHFQVMSKIPDAYRDHLDMKWLCSSAYKWQVMDRLSLAAGGALPISIIEGVPTPMFLGYPVVLSDRMPTATAVSTVSALFGNFPRAVALGDRGGVRVAVSDQFAFDTDRIAMRATVRYDLNCHECGDGSTAGAIAGLKTGAAA